MRRCGRFAANDFQVRQAANHGKIIESQGKDIAALEQKIMELRNSAIQAEISSGVPTKNVAQKYGISSARVSQIAPRSNYN